MSDPNETAPTPADTARAAIERAEQGAPDAAAEVAKATEADAAATEAAEQEASEAPGGRGLSR